MRPRWLTQPSRLLLAGLMALLALAPAPAAEAATRQARIASEARRIAAAWKATSRPRPSAAALARARAAAHARAAALRAAAARRRAWRPRPKPWALAWKPPARHAAPAPPPPLYLGDLYVAASQAPLLQRPAPGAARLANLPRRTVVTNMGRVGNFHKVEAPNGAVGYVALRALSTSPPQW